jgi:hypothetical protein
MYTLNKGRTRRIAPAVQRVPPEKITLVADHRISGESLEEMRNILIEWVEVENRFVQEHENNMWPSERG